MTSDAEVKVTELGYLGISVSNGAAWKAYAGGVAGMEVVDEGEKDRFYLRMDLWHHRIVVHTDGGDDLAYMGWRVGGPDELDAMARQLNKAGVDVRVGSEAEATERHVLGLIKLNSPNGTPVEIFYGPRVDAHKPFHPGRPMFGSFVVGNEHGMGHCVVREDDVEAAYHFYSLLGLRGSPELKTTLPNGQVAKIWFMHCNDRQHSVAFGVPMQKRINHLMVEYTELNDLGLAHEAVRRKGFDVALTLGKHCNDQALTYYAANPSGWLWEFGWGARKSLQSQEYSTCDVFGHTIEKPGYGIDIPLSPPETSSKGE